MMLKLKISWLFSLWILGMAIVMLGGLTRLTDSGLSMTNWSIIAGSIPPLSLEAWQTSLSHYLDSPEGKLINQDITLARYRFIFLMEYSHRMLGRLIWLWVLIPFIFFYVKKSLTNKEIIYHICLVALISLQGLAGWYMVKSGLVDEPKVSHFRLALHFWLALFFIAAIFIRIVYLLDKRQEKVTLAIGWFIKNFFITHRMLAFITLLHALQIIYGNFMAGLDAGLISNTYPFMFGRLIPTLEDLFPLATVGDNLFSNPVFVHFLHRHLGMLLFILISGYYFTVRWQKKDYRHPKLNLALNCYLGIIIFQVMIGIGLIFSNVGMISALLHQLSTLFTVFSLLFLIYVKTEPPSLSSAR